MNELLQELAILKVKVEVMEKSFEELQEKLSEIDKKLCKILERLAVAEQYEKRISDLEERQTLWSVIKDVMSVAWGFIKKWLGVALLLIFIVFITTVYADCICFYLETDYCSLPQNSCKLYSELVPEGCSIEPLRRENLRNADIVIFSGFGHYSGLFLDTNFERFDNILTWEEVASYGRKVLVIDACYAGCFFRKTSRRKGVITSTGCENSVNIFYKDGWYGTLAVALNCLYNKQFNCPVNCRQFGNDVDACQFRLITESLCGETVRFLKWEHPSVGTALVEGKPWR